MTEKSMKEEEKITFIAGKVKGPVKVKGDNCTVLMICILILVSQVV